MDLISPITAQDDDNDEQVDQLESNIDEALVEVPTTPKARQMGPPASPMPSFTSPGQTFESALPHVQSSYEKMVLKAAFDKLSAIVESTAKETVGQTASSTNSIAKELREIICKRAVMASNGLQWSTLLEIMAENGCYFDNYPSITLPGVINSASRKKGIREVPVEEQRILLDAMKATYHRCVFKAYNSQSPGDVKALQKSEAPIIRVIQSYHSDPILTPFSDSKWDQ
ncbi:hypothetical protein JOM56_014192 [Amanita muscaria]